jgi:hypothetical protein
VTRRFFLSGRTTQRWLNGSWQRRAKRWSVRSRVEVTWEEERKRGGNPPLRRIRTAPAWAVAMTGGDRRLRAHHREHSYRMVTGSVASGVGPVTGAGG